MKCKKKHVGWVLEFNIDFFLLLFFIWQYCLTIPQEAVDFIYGLFFPPINDTFTLSIQAENYWHNNRDWLTCLGEQLRGQKWEGRHQDFPPALGKDFDHCTDHEQRQNSVKNHTPHCSVIKGDRDTCCKTQILTLWLCGLHFALTHYSWKSQRQWNKLCA